MPTRAEAVRAGRRSAIDGALRRFQARALTALSTAADWMKTGRKCPLVVECLLWFCSRELMSPPDPPFSTRSRVAGRNIRRRYVWIASVQAAEDPASALHWNVVSVVHMRWRMTASLRATAMVAFLAPTRLPRVSPHVFSALGRAERLSNTLAASNRRQRTMPSPHLEIRPA